MEIPNFQHQQPQVQGNQGHDSCQGLEKCRSWYRHELMEYLDFLYSGKGNDSRIYESSSTHVPSIAESGKLNTCLISSSSKWVIDFGVTNHMTDLMTKKNIGKGHECGAYVTFLEAAPYFQSFTLAHRGENDDLLAYTITSFKPVSEPDLAKPPILQRWETAFIIT
ncbi:hypothetical protein SADUNF_Sadunf16G0233800 [Salix dunnii]|uniref:Uncharacterized protein n=1 Tax=Salix dunnii TaxID=1413687 RepID=A0A835J8C1_9ROSI|nr:hypothetical protein SADUNF_Sadunf16G0233800 [Salix dunnii]